MAEKPKRVLQQSSPLESLVRRASSRKIKKVSSVPRPDSNVGPSDLQAFSNMASIVHYDQQQQSQPGLDINRAPPRKHSPAPPPSPLLHTHFRSSVATTYSNDHSFQRESGDDENIYFDGPSVHDASDPTRHSWHSADSDTPTISGPAVNLHNKGDSTQAVIVTAPEPEPNSQYGVVLPDFHTTSSGHAWSDLLHAPSSPQKSRPPQDPTRIQNAIPSSSSLYLRPNISHASPSLPSSRPISSESVYSSNSYFLDETDQHIVAKSDSDQIPSRSQRSEHQPSPLLQPQSPQDYLQLGIKHHEANRLDQAAMYFEKSAKEKGGCGVGMLMFGLTLRHGWGCAKNEKGGLHWLQKAAESAVSDLESGNPGVNAPAVQGELVIAIYEVGQSFLQGWGVQKDKKMAVSYFRVAAGLGDPDAQQSLAFCLANGKGCKKDRKEAAKWYRAAVAQGGISDVGLAWIYKDKYQ